MSIETLKRELSKLSPKEQRHLVAYMVSLQETHNAAYKESLARKIDDRAPSHFATLEEMDARLGISDETSSK